MCTLGFHYDSPNLISYIFQQHHTLNFLPKTNIDHPKTLKYFCFVVVNPLAANIYACLKDACTKKHKAKHKKLCLL